MILHYRMFSILFIAISALHAWSANAFEPAYEEKRPTIPKKLRKIDKKLLLDITSGNYQGMVNDIRNGADVNVTDSGGTTPLMYAAISGNMPIIQRLLHSGAFPNYPSNAELSALHYAAIHNHPHVIARLLSAGANMNAPDNIYNHFTPLTYAAQNGSIDAVRELLYHGADGQRKIALQVALKNGHPFVARAIEESMRRHPEVLIKDEPSYIKIEK